ncbi:ATP synthase F1 subunit gamma [Clostridium celatum]|uniref:ATP synthase gamma chain n=1 Tax=Clostridium celatum DSM 1785 TaxID=545697 RepID=L1QJ01_9CLOT|nr:ATP synthase F1 subunit gamma [Clostridium celatum]EKY27665.1 ATP synthase F1, gamma subunit [Clostridium celatum DSM 1785]MCE9655628.1 F0F1 ATP synthase subunit gamma [Clostridium celatum]MDU2266057.1 ATP synthase F1 subunit gamma [Clostridium celatum]MDU6296993.1 ATP synthase F1 subunit gamma [Clostridium celatum]MDY3359972.1 ATP synthase F1 subunit gamma [Clostridium celatum]
MGAAGLIEIKRRIKSVESTRKITKAMGLVATSKLRKVRKELIANEQYSNMCKEVINEVISSIPEGYESIYFNENNGDKLYIVLTSDTGLCAGYNNNVALILSNRLIKESNESKVLVVGSKGISYLSRYGVDTFNEYVDLPDIPATKDINKIYNDAIYLYEKGEVSEVNIVYTKFISPVKQEVLIEKILPIKKDRNLGTEYIIEPSVEEVLKNSMDMYLKSQLKTCMLSAKASEHSARMTAMDGATENANDLLQELSIKFNRIRQGIITQEISEIVGGAEAQK